MVDETKKEEIVQTKIDAKVIIPIVGNNVEKPIVDGANFNIAMIVQVLEMAKQLVLGQKYN